MKSGIADAHVVGKGLAIPHATIYLMQRLNPGPGAATPSAGGYKWTTEEVNKRLRRFVWAQ